MKIFRIVEIQNWIRGLGFPDDIQEIYDLQDQKVGSARIGLNLTGTYILMESTILDASYKKFHCEI